MNDGHQLADNGGSVGGAVRRDGCGVNQVAERTTGPIRSRWSPKPEQILILESIFNSGMVNPPKDETVRIRKLLERFGSVGDANVFYWFQNRRSRSRRRLRQMQSGIQALIRDEKSSFHVDPAPFCSSSSSSSSSSSFSPFSPPLLHDSVSPHLPQGNAAALGPTSGHGGLSVNDTYSASHLPVDEAVNVYPVSKELGSHHIDQPYLVSSILTQSSSAELITVSINGIIFQVPRGPFHMRALFGEDVILVHSSGDPIHVDVSGVSLQGLQPGESYFLVNVPFPFPFRETVKFTNILFFAF
ncbi:WUSCHEL-related homeobox 11-like isoform X2 [Nymphaea colorata]|uniref:WUSCHEL-related homeobox 11-like isoform X2 n=1 Tax=Nymphaea colorata TaxID=210225 RepID=UPI00129E1E34|nr:WUSCHEL-related homeobox 11-like isoform X2 [Nymphaea colorata]